MKGNIMSLIKRISDFFKSQKPTRTEARLDGGEAKLTIEEILQDEQVTSLLSKYKKQTTFLQPYRSDKEIDFTKSKMGGMPNINGFQEWPMCDECGAPLNFILQLYKSDFPDFWYYLMILVKLYYVYKHQRLIPAHCYAVRPSLDVEGR